MIVGESVHGIRAKTVSFSIAVTPAWNLGEVYLLKDKIPVDSRQEDTVGRSTIEEVLQEKWLVGRRDSWIRSVKSEKAYYEQWRKSATNDNKSMNPLKTQTTLPITPGKLMYEVEVPSGGHTANGYQVLKKEKSFGHYFPADVDDSLKTDYANKTKYSGYDYAFPLQQSVQADKGLSSGKRVQEWDYTTDLFFMTKYTGFSIGTPYASMMKESILNGRIIPTYETLMKEGTEKIGKAFTNTTGQKFVDDVLYTDSKEEFKRLQRNAIPISPKSPLKPNETYLNHLVLDNMGLSDGVFEFDQSFAFEHYLFGSGYDDAWIIEQSEGRPIKIDQMDPADVQTITIKHEDKMSLIELIFGRPKEKIHSTRVTDRDFGDKVRAIIGF